MKRISFRLILFFAHARIGKLAAFGSMWAAMMKSPFLLFGKMVEGCPGCCYNLRNADAENASISVFNNLD